MNDCQCEFGSSDLRRWLSVVAALLCFAIAASPAAADPTFGVMNAEGGIYWRSAPDWNTPEAVPGNGFYPDTIVSIHCYQAGAGNVPGSADYMWEQATNVGGSGFGSGWINEHFINDGQPINQPSPGVPPCGGSTPAPPPAAAPPSALPPPSPLPASGGGLIFSIFNAEGGVYYRRSPSWGDTPKTPGVGVYNGDKVELICGALGDSVGPYNNKAWSKVRNLTRPVGEGWVNEHFINDGAASNSFVAGESMCGGSSTGSGGSLYFSPYPANPHGPNSTGQIKGDNPLGIGTNWVKALSPATITLNLNDWDKNIDGRGCPALDNFVPKGLAVGQISTLASWSRARAAPFLFLRGTQLRSSIHYILLFDPGNQDEWDNAPCSKEYPLSNILREWLIESPSNKLAILAGELTADVPHRSVDGHGHAGIQDQLFVPLKKQAEPTGRNLRSQIVVCNYDHTSHPDVWIDFKAWINKPPITLGSCPNDPYNGRK